MRFSLYLNWLPTELEYLHYIRLLKSGNRDGLLEWRPDWTPLFDFVNTTDSLTKDTVRWEFKQNYGKFRIKRIPNFFKDFNNNDIVNDNYQSKDGTLFDNNNFDGNSALFICCRLNCDLTFAQEFDLSHFPFDCQDLSLLMCDRTTERFRVKFLPYLSGIRHRFVTIDSTYSVLNDWIVDSVFLSFDHRLHGRGRQSLAFIELRINLRRKWESYLWRQFFFEFFFSAVGLTSFAIHYDLANRLILLVTLLLTMVAFSLVLDDKIPNVPYLTYLEKFIFMNYAFLAYLLCESIFSEYYEVDNMLMFWYSLTIFGILQFIFAVYGWYIRWYEMVKVNCPFHERKQYMNKEKGVFGVDYEINDILRYSASYGNTFTSGNDNVMNTIEHDYSNGYNDQRHHLPMNQLSFRQSVNTTLDNLTQLQLQESYDKLKRHSTHVSKRSGMYNSYQNE